MPTLYIIEPGARLEKEYQRLLVTKADEVLLRLPIQRVTQVVLVGRVGVTTPALYALLQAEIPLLLVNRSGRLRGRLLPPTARNLPLRQQQYRRNDDPDFCLRLAQAIIAAKIHNQRTLALRLLRRHPHINPKGINNLIVNPKSKIENQKSSIANLMGIEGSAARAYFRIYRQAFGEQWNFHKRTRRPPKDPVNALLSLGYSFLTQAMMTALEAAGLDPYLGYFHSEKYGRPTLALDLVEEFRTPIVDSLVLSLLNHRLLKEKDFEFGSASEGVRLTTRGFRVFLRKYSEKLESKIKSRKLGRSISYRKLFEVQARHLARTITNQDNQYKPFRSR
ncbi:CRISPR-associated endonuclease Cas1 [Candidatus Leptofilum sp.]|uniref:CRISPR-associated endonuclease Cas1 n=1 Tax=Candidatus Leptofilum sp. TaxID=3241576 RepID=UPI003B5CBC4F